MSSPTQSSQKLANLIQDTRHLARRQTRCQQEIYEHLLNNAETISSANFKSISSADLGLLFQVTDEQFFQGLVGIVCEQLSPKPLSFRLSTRMTSSGGMTTMQSLKRSRNSRQFEFEIAIATTPLFSSFRESETVRVGGLPCHDRLEALQRIMEHEMVHLIEMLLWRDSNCSASRFKGIVSRFFGHTESNHQLMTPTDLAKRHLGISPGDAVVFSIEGRQIQGHVNSITKRATVLVPDSRGTLYNDGVRYTKYYVPLGQLKRA